MLSIGADGAQLIGLDVLDSILTQQNTFDVSDQLWNYQKQGTINGIHVSELDLGLPVETADKLLKAFGIHSTVNVWAGYLSPLLLDKESLRKYALLMQAAQDNSIIIYSLDKQFCSTNKYLVVLTYGKVEYKLNPRYAYLKDQKINE